MKNTTKAILAMAVCAVSAAALADFQYFYWQVDLGAEGKNPYGVEDFSYATMKDSQNNLLSFYNTTGDAIDTTMAVDDYLDAGDKGTKAGPLYSGVDAGDTVGSTYLFELWKEDTKGKATKVGWASYTYSQIADSMYQTRSTSGGDSPFTIGVIPEPASGLLVLVGAGLMAWRRRKSRSARVLTRSGGRRAPEDRRTTGEGVPEADARRLSLMALATIVSLGAFAAGDNLIYSFKPNANDAYADGTPVLAGERYALVWLAKGSDGVTIAADGTVADPSKGEIVRVRRSLGRGELFTFQVDAKVKDALAAKGGSWAVYLLDTRVCGADGQVTLAACADGQVASVNAAIRVSESVVAVAANDAQQVAKAATAASQATDATAVPADAPRPTITGITVENGEVRVKVRDTVPYLQYNLAAGSEPDAVSGKAAKSPQNGVAGQEIELVAPVTASGAAFFQVRRN